MLKKAKEDLAEFCGQDHEAARAATRAYEAALAELPQPSAPPPREALRRKIAILVRLEKKQKKASEDREKQVAIVASAQKELVRLDEKARDISQQLAKAKLEEQAAMRTVDAESRAFGPTGGQAAQDWSKPPPDMAPEQHPQFIRDIQEVYNRYRTPPPAFPPWAAANPGQEAKEAAEAAARAAAAQATGQQQQGGQAGTLALEAAGAGATPESQVVVVQAPGDKRGAEEARETDENEQPPKKKGGSTADGGRMELDDDEESEGEESEDEKRATKEEVRRRLEAAERAAALSRTPLPDGGRTGAAGSGS